MMGKILSLTLYLTIFLHLLKIGNTNFLGGTISWFSYKNRLRFVYRLTWDKGAGPCGVGCTTADIGKMGTLPANLQSLSWNCTHGCGSNIRLHDVNYYTTTASNSTPGYEQGENYFFLNQTGSDVFEVSLQRLNWSISAPGEGRLVTRVNLGIRNDTNLPNASPIVAPPAYLGVKYGSVTEFKLPVEDPDADSIRCRFASKSECGDACNSMPNPQINTDNCTIIINATKINGYFPNKEYRVAVTVEDFPDYTIKVGGNLHGNTEAFSSVPFQFVINTVQTLDINDMRIALPTVKYGTRVPYPGKPQVYTQAMYVTTSEKNSTFFVVSNPAKMKYDQLDDDNNRVDVTRIYGTWNNVDKNQYGDAMACSWPLNANGLTSTGVCIIPMINDTYECRPNICKRNGTCIDLWHRVTCKCPSGYKRPYCIQKITCADSPCRYNQSCEDSNGVYRCVIPMVSATQTGNIETNIFTSQPITATVNVGTSSSSNAVPIAIGTVAALVSAATTAGCCWYFLAGPGKRKKKKENQIAPEEEEEKWAEKASDPQPSASDNSDRPKTAKPTTDHAEVEMKEVKDDTS